LEEFLARFSHYWVVPEEQPLANHPAIILWSGEGSGNKRTLFGAMGSQETIPIEIEWREVKKLLEKGLSMELLLEMKVKQRGSVG